MVPVLLLLLQTAVNGVGLASQKKYQQAAPPGMRSYLLFLSLTGAVALLFFSISAGFRLTFNWPTFWYAVGYAASVAGSIVLRFLAMARMNMLLLTLFTNAGAMLVPVLFGALVFDEKLGLFPIIGLVLMSGAVIMPFLGKGEALRARPRDCLYGALLFVVGGVSPVLMKFYTNDPRAADSNSYCFLTNLIMLVGTLAVLVYSLRRGGSGEATVQEVFTPRQCILTLLTTVTSNISSLLGIWVLRGMPVSIYTMLSNSLNMASTAMLSKVAFREKITLAQVLSAVLAVLAVVCSLL